MSDRVRELLEAGLTRKEIAERVGLSVSTVSSYARRLGYRAHPARASHFDWAEIRAYYESGATMRDCKKRFGVSNGAWYDAVARGDIAPRAHPRARHAHERRKQVEALLAQGLSMRETADRLGVSRATVSYHARRLGIPPNEACARRYDWDEVQRYYDEGHSITACVKHFGFSRKTFWDAMQRGAIVTRPQAAPIEQVLIAGRARNRGHIKMRLLSAGLKQNRCEECGLSEWRGKPLSLALHHVNGDGRDNRLENLSMLCPNCHSQTENFGGRGARRRHLRAVESAP